MPVLSAANVVQAKTGSADSVSSVNVTLDNPTQPGGTVTVEMFGPPLWPGMPPGWDFDVTSNDELWLFRYSGGPGGETTWPWTAAAPVSWLWRVTEWDAGLDPVAALDAQPGTNTATGAGVTTVSSGTTGTSNRPNTVALATHLWRFSGTSAQTFDWSAHTNGFTERDELRVSVTGEELDASWSWLFNTSTGAFECTATTNTTPRHAGDIYYTMVAVYAATQPVAVAAPSTLVV